MDNTDQATAHYYNGKGQPVHLGPTTLKALLTSNDFRYHHKRILNGKTTALSGNFSVDLTYSEFYIGRTNVDYKIGCANGKCKVTYKLFKNDGFWDPDFVAERTLGRLGIKKYQPDGMGPNLEFSGGKPYWFIPIVAIYQFKDPGY